MTDSTPPLPQFSRPPVLETHLGIQFSPMVGFKSGHFGLFWRDCVGLEGWKISEDQLPIPTKTEKFGSKYLRTPPKEEPGFPKVLMRLTREDGSQSVQFQPNRLVYGWKRNKHGCLPFGEVQRQFGETFGRLESFADQWRLGTPVPSLWEITYTNVIHKGRLWDTPADWHRILPGIFPPTLPSAEGHEWATFTGNWIFDIVPERGRVEVQVQKSVPNQSGDIVLLLIITARGEIGEKGSPDWHSGLSLGHQSAVRVFHDLTSRDAHEEWGGSGS